MFDFREIQLSDRDWINGCLKISDFRGCEYSFANNLAWRRLSNTLIASYKDFYISCSFDGKQPVITFPTGVGCDGAGIEKYLDLFSKLKRFVESQGYSFKISSVNSQNLEWMNEYYKDKISVEANRDSFDYIYNAQDLIELKGKKYHGKRNHIKRFKDNEWSFEPLTSDNFDECTAFAAQTYNVNKGYDDFSAVVEQYAIHTFFSSFDYLGLKGGLLRSNGKTVGFTIGEQLNSDTFVVHIEKALSEVQGAYPAICNEFACRYAGNFKYINREEDLGIEGLRKSKLSYHPAFLHEKYTVTFR
ncbi:phosphatidylglycerol lysyltransferase domain-containing protein [Ruminococcus sp. Marseille-P6503]|uniref:DUF2156 domain-containing protein n=1 Tax=Ruminococcus sp. Marseille-P6503 TaxID=2364796 RepID=UPI000F540174|nr:phosphatidylglycerol lysyltransferase domain-containing protein [Ruminococcus sp. Marseille-P6503]